ncbi:MAG: hemerythrin domain-containing protein [Candidatus Omnitrophica bacterium]|nr:hemerythrin domain-containing protein [Candidatus Omnitrophota bacterium]
MLPIGQLMIEHRLIERVIRLWEGLLDTVEEGKAADTELLAYGIDFMHTYADRCHHGKEEDILFRDLKKKNLSPELARILRELVDEHVISRNTVKELSCARERYIAKEKNALNDILAALKVIVNLYPAHIQKEDKRFFIPCMEYFTSPEKEAMIREFEAFDRNLIHEKYKSLVKGMESAKGVKPQK